MKPAPTRPAGLPDLGRPLPVLALMLLFALVWLGHLQSVALSAPMDNVEQWVWRLSLQWGYHKHPPFPTWALWAAHAVAGRHALTAAIVGAGLSLLSIGLMHALLRQTCSGFAAWLGLLAALLITFYNGRLNYYNHNILLMVFVALTVYSWWQILQSGRTGWWILLGLSAGLGMLSKYQYLLIVPPSLVCLAWLRPWQSRKTLLQLALALALALLLFLPHALWLLNQPGGDSPLGYASQTARPALFGGEAPLAALLHSGNWLLDLVLNRCLPAWLLLLGVRLWLRRTDRDALARSGPQPTGAGVRADSFLLLWGLLPACTITALGVVMGMDLQLQWGTAFALWLVPAGLVLLKLQRVSPAPRLWGVALGLWLALQLLLLAHSHSTSSAGCCTNDKWRNFDTPAIARELDASAREKVGGQFRVLVGAASTMGAIAMALPDRPRVLIEGRLRISPWITAEDLAGPGVVQLFAPGQAPADAVQLPNGWSWRVFKPQP